MNAAAAVTVAIILGVFFQSHTYEQEVTGPAVTWPKASVRTAGSEGRLWYGAHK